MVRVTNGVRVKVIGRVGAREVSLESYEVLVLRMGIVIQGK